MTMHEGPRPSSNMLRGRIWKMVREGDLEKLTVKDIRKALEKEFGKDNVDMNLVRSYVSTCVKRKSKLLEQQQVDQQKLHESESRKLKEPPTGESPLKICRLSPELQAVTGQPILRRTEAVKRLWEYIRENKLQDPGDRRMVICSGNKLYDLFKVDRINIFIMNKHLKEHFLPIEEGYEDIDVPKKKKQKTEATRRNGCLTPYPISKALQSFFGTHQTKMSRAEVIQRVWEYILDNGLQKCTGEHRVMSDEKLEKLLQKKSLSYTQVAKCIARHFVTEEEATEMVMDLMVLNPCELGHLRYDRM